MIRTIDIIHIFDEIPIHKKNELCNFLNVKDFRNITRYKSMPIERYKKILSFIEKSKKDSVTFVSKVPVSDLEQERDYYVALTNFIKSSEFENLLKGKNARYKIKSCIVNDSVKNRNRILDEHKRLGNKLNKNQ